MEKRREQTTIRLPAELREKVQQEAECKGYTITDLILFILWNHVGKAIHQV